MNQEMLSCNVSERGKHKQGGAITLAWAVDFQILPYPLRPRPSPLMAQRQTGRDPTINHNERWCREKAVGERRGRELHQP